MGKKLLLLISAIIVGLLILFLFQGTPQSGSKPVADVNLNLTLSKLPRVGETAELSLTATPHKDASNATAEIDIPDGIRIVSGDSFWKGKLKANSSVTLQVKIKPIKSGGYYLRGTFHNTLPPENYGENELAGGNAKVIPLSTTPYFATTIFIPWLWGSGESDVKTGVQTNISHKK